MTAFLAVIRQCTLPYDRLGLEILRVTAVCLPQLRILRPGVAGRLRIVQSPVLLLECAAASYWLDGFALLQSAAAVQTTAITDHGGQVKSQRQRESVCYSGSV